MTPLRVVVVDDEPLARQRLRRLLDERDDCRLVAEFDNGLSFAAAIPGLAADLVLLDVDMPGCDGFASLQDLGPARPLVVFVTAYDGFAARAFDIDAVDYVVKPVSAARLGDAIDRAWRRLREAEPGRMAAMRPAVARFIVQGRTYLFEQDRITSLQALGNYVELTCETRTVQLRMTLAFASSRLTAGQFVRVHRSWIVRRSAIAEITSLPGARSEIVLTDGRRVPGGRVYLQNIRAASRVAIAGGAHRQRSEPQF